MGYGKTPRSCPALLRKTIIDAAVKRLRESYPDCNADNILTDSIYSAFAKSSLELTIEDAGENSVIGRGCRKLIDEIKARKQ